MAAMSARSADVQAAENFFAWASADSARSARTLLTPTLFLRHGAAPLARLVAQARERAGADGAGAAPAKSAQAF